MIYTVPGGALRGHDAIAEILGSEIVSGARSPDSRLPSPAEFHERFGASKALLREVAKTLAAKGLVAAKPKVGTRVRSREHWNWFDPEVVNWRMQFGADPDFINQLADLRYALGPTIAAFAARRRSDDHLEMVHKALATMTSAVVDRRKFIKAQTEFHISVASASGNALLLQIATVVETALCTYFLLSAQGPATDMGKTIRFHKRLVDAIEKGDSVSAQSAMAAVIAEDLKGASITGRNAKTPD